MYWFRFWQQPDLPFLTQAATAGTWESMSLEERQAATPAQVSQIAAGQVAEVLRGPWGLGLVALYGLQPVGFMLGAVTPDSSTDEPTAHVLTVWVAPAHRRRGLARQLLTQAESVFAAQGLRKVKVWSGLHNPAAMQLARSLGYEPEGLIGMKSL
jgi:ribosomal protein S18 acetylase RimI-like enzyme